MSLNGARGFAMCVNVKCASDSKMRRQPDQRSLYRAEHSSALPPGTHHLYVNTSSSPPSHFDITTGDLQVCGQIGHTLRGTPLPDPYVRSR